MWDYFPSRKTLLHTSLNSNLWATASKHSCPVLSTESVNSTKSPFSSWIRVTRQLLLETVYLRVLLSFKPNGRGMFYSSSNLGRFYRLKSFYCPRCLLRARWEHENPSGASLGYLKRTRGINRRNGCEMNHSYQLPHLPRVTIKTYVSGSNLLMNEAIIWVSLRFFSFF